MEILLLKSQQKENHDHFQTQKLFTPITTVLHKMSSFQQNKSYEACEKTKKKSCWQETKLSTEPESDSDTDAGIIMWGI